MNELAREMIIYDKGDPQRIQHFLKVHAFAKLIGEGENISGKDLYVLETAAYVHDIGIKVAEAQYGKCDGKLQEELGPKEAVHVLQTLGYEESVIERVAYLVGHHHTYDRIDGIDYQILVEADFLVNMFEGSMDEQHRKTVYERMFKTETGKELCRTMFGM